MYTTNSGYDNLNIENNREFNIWRNDLLFSNSNWSQNQNFDSSDSSNLKQSSIDLHGSFYNVGIGMAENILSNSTIDPHSEELTASLNDIVLNNSYLHKLKNTSPNLHSESTDLINGNYFDISCSPVDQILYSRQKYADGEPEFEDSWGGEYGDFYAKKSLNASFQNINTSPRKYQEIFHNSSSIPISPNYAYEQMYNKTSILSNLLEPDLAMDINKMNLKDQNQLKMNEMKTIGVPKQKDGSIDKISKAEPSDDLLEQFKNSLVLQNTLQLRDLVGHMIDFSKDQHGSRLIQHRLENAPQIEKSLLLNEMLAPNTLISLVTDVFGNYVVQKMIEHGTADQRKRLVNDLQGKILSLSLQMYGCRVIQKALEFLSEDVQIAIIAELDGHVLKCVKDQNGNHVIQKCIECVNSVQLNKIVDAFKTQVFSLSAHPYGCRVIQRILEHCNNEQKTLILNELHQCANYLVKDQYGNYVIQHVIEHGSDQHRAKLIDILSDDAYELSQHKFASNVVEKCIVFSSKAQRARIIDKICLETDALLVMTKDQFANYVVQKMLDLCEVPQRKKMLSILKPNLPSLRKYTYGKHIVAKVEKWISSPRSINDKEENECHIEISFKKETKKKL